MPHGPNPSPDFRTVCQYVGRLFLESQHELEARDAQASQVLQQLRDKEKRIAELEEKVRELTEATRRGTASA